MFENQYQQFDSIWLEVHGIGRICNNWTVLNSSTDTITIDINISVKTDARGCIRHGLSCAKYLKHGKLIFFVATSLRRSYLESRSCFGTVAMCFISSGLQGFTQHYLVGTLSLSLSFSYAISCSLHQRLYRIKIYRCCGCCGKKQGLSFTTEWRCNNWSRLQSTEDSDAFAVIKNVEVNGMRI